MELRPYQERLIEEVRQQFIAGHTAVIMQLSTGGGKTMSVVNMIYRALHKGNKSWFLCHRQELVKQAGKTMDTLNVPHGIIAAGFTPMLHRNVQVCSIQTLARRMKVIRNIPQLVVIDECHHANAKVWSDVINQLRDKGSKVIGLTATPTRLDGRGLDEHFTAMVCGPQTEWLIEQGYLSPFKCYAPSKVDLNGVKTLAGDYAKDQLAALMDKPNITGDLVHHYQTITPGKKALVFAVKVEHSKHIAEAFNAAGIRAEHVDGETPKEQRSDIIDKYAKGEIRVLTNVDLFGEGFDIPDAEVAILARPTQSLSLHLQMVGRVLRPVYAKDMPIDTPEQRREAISKGPKPFAYILDHASNNIVHGLPDEFREWTLKGREKRGGKKKKEEGPPIRQCPKCYFVQKAELDACGNCGHVFEKKGRNVEQVDGELRELTKDDKIKLAQERAKQARREQASAHSLEQLIQLGRNRGYKQPEAWARYVFKSRGVR
jgi:DNA repair protein RadD